MTGGELRAEPVWRPGRLYNWTRVSALVLLAAGIAGFLIQGANRPANPYLVPSSGSASLSLGTFPTISLAVASGSGVVQGSGSGGGPGSGAGSSGAGSPGHDPCFLAATTTAQQETGLMGQTSLHGYAGMVFLFSQPTTDSFYMRSTPMPLSIAWFDQAGRFISSTTMPPCPPGISACPTYNPGRPYSTAVEVPAGHLAALGIGPGSTVQPGGPCQP